MQLMPCFLAYGLLITKCVPCVLADRFIYQCHSSVHVFSVSVVCYHLSVSLISLCSLCFSRMFSLIRVTHQIMISLFQSCVLTYPCHSSVYDFSVSVVLIGYAVSAVFSHLSVPLIDLCSLCFSRVFSLISVTHQFMFSLFQSCLSVTPCAPCFLTYPCHSSVYDFSVSVVLIGYAVCALFSHLSVSLISL